LREHLKIWTKIFKFWLLPISLWLLLNLGMFWLEDGKAVKDLTKSVWLLSITCTYFHRTILLWKSWWAECDTSTAKTPTDSGWFVFQPLLQTTEKLLNG
jgi:hypothetical protein